MSKTHYSLKNLIGLFLLVLLAFACKEDEPKPDSSPTIQILIPSEEITIELGEQISLKAAASDAEEGELTDIDWSSDKDGQLGRGTEISVNNLSENRHTITAQVEDSKGNTANATITVVVEAANTDPEITFVSTLIEKTYQNRSFVVEAKATDAEDGNLTEIVWFSDKDGELGTGNPFTITNLSPQNHQIMAKTTDSNGATVEVSFEVEILEVDGDLFRLANWMVGSFSSENQADSSSDVYHVDVRVHLVQIWEERTDGYWLYIEQAYADDLADPYRQRIYHLTSENGVLSNTTYSLPRGLNFSGQWRNPDFFDAVTPEDLTEKVGCGLDFEFIEEDNWFFTETIGKDCTASIPGVAYLQTTSTIAEDHFTSWDLGYNSNDVIVLGPFSPYYFDKLEAYEAK